MIPQDDFVAARHRDWTALDLLIGGGALKADDGAVISRMAALYRSLCNDLTRAEAARYSPDLLTYLHGLAGRAHNVLYRAKPLSWTAAARMMFVEFPLALRRNWRLFTLACALFLVPWAVGLLGAMGSSTFAQSVLPIEMLEGLSHAYSEGFSRGRDAGQDSGMAGFYVFNNVGIAFRCFATGILFGLGTIFFLVYNGLIIGTVTGYVTQAGHGENIWTFMCGHGPFEITAIFIAGGAGLQMGYALVATGGLTRFGSLRRHAHDITAQVVGAALMLIIAAFIEGFWSPSSMPNQVKWAVGALNALLVLTFLTLGGRSLGGRPEAPELRGGGGA